MDTVSGPSPENITTVEEFKAQLRALKAWSGLSFRELERRARLAGDTLPCSTGEAMVGSRRRNLPREEQVMAFTRACGCPADRVDEWVRVRRRIAATSAVPAAELSSSERAGGVGVRPLPPPGSPSLHGRAPRAAPLGGRARRWILAAAGAVLSLSFAGDGVIVPDTAATGPRSPSTDGCPEPIGIGTYGPCALQLQRQLRSKGIPLPEDSWFGPFTKQRLVAFQAFAALPITGTADHRTRRALAELEPVRRRAWTAAQVEQRLAEVFPEQRDEAVKLVRCLSYLDPLWVMPNSRGVRYWGLFQFSDPELLALGAGPAAALDPEWNIQTARMIWSRTKDFRHWTCEP
ncbi:peptidoglycan-binding protein [Actinomadura sp. KC06]|uniref:peptidoglycan-binding protein n=1 Tax=Actinomadura sp. KC06 TaxID=2530369 RepID=UPI0010430EDC|nr:peptidoglycan-binding protein [Actinomadura sp. KC06]TDD22906.1 peptidoglycan-binding protein [Actinomadura sp. KC06]